MGRCDTLMPGEREMEGEGERERERERETGRGRRGGGEGGTMVMAYLARPRGACCAARMRSSSKGMLRQGDASTSAHASLDARMSQRGPSRLRLPCRISRQLQTGVSPAACALC